jgi:rare lipoprotein A
MNRKLIILLFTIISIIFSINVWSTNPPQKDKNKSKSKDKTIITKESKEAPLAKIDTIKTKPLSEVPEIIDSVKVEPVLKFKFYKKNAHASYYAAKFHGKRTASGLRFDNNKYTAAHKKLPFGTKVRVTNEANGKFVIVEITDRGPYSKVREIDLSKKAFMELVDNKNTGGVIVKLEVEDK